MNVTVLGAGAMGCLFGGRLADAGHHVVLIDVRAAQIDAINDGGLILELDGQVDDEAGQETRIETRIRTVRLEAHLPADAREQTELVLLFTKAFHSEAALAGARAVIGTATWIVTLQNGLGAVDAIRKYVDASRIVVGTTTLPGDLVGLGRVRSRGGGLTKIMSVEGGVTDRLRRLGSMLSGAGIECEIVEQIWTTIWEKLAFNAALNSLAAVTGLTVGQLGSAAEGRALADRVAQEVIAVAQRKGIAARLASVQEVIAMAFREHVHHKPSMLEDVLARRRTEIDFINGAVVREAMALGVPVPTTAALAGLVRLLEHGYPAD
jgi:2-dehydropantoate 2-reductase